MFSPVIVFPDLPQTGFSTSADVWALMFLFMGPYASVYGPLCLCLLPVYFCYCYMSKLNVQGMNTDVLSTLTLLTINYFISVGL